MRQVLMVAERPGLAHTLSEFLSDNHAVRGLADKKVPHGLPLFEWVGRWPITGETVQYKMTSTYGHVNRLEFSREHTDWRCDPKTLFSCRLNGNQAPNQQVLRQLSTAAYHVDVLVLWQDCDADGEQIGCEVMDHVLPKMKKAADVYRARFSALTKDNIRAALQGLRRPNRHMADAVDARVELDLRIGQAFTRFLTRFFVGSYGADALQTNTVPFGTCQTPALGFCVQRHEEIEKFQSEVFWCVNVDVELPSSFSSDKPVSRLEWSRKVTGDRDAANRILEQVKASRTIAVANVTTELEKRKQRSLPLNTSHLLRLASSQLSPGMSPLETMDAAERLYTDGFITYPRTATTAYPSTFDRIGALMTLSGPDEMGQYAEKLVYDGFDSSAFGDGRGDLPPITPLKKATPALMRNPQRAYELFHLICRHFLAALSSDCLYTERTAEFDVSGEVFLWVGTTVTQPGFTEILTEQKVLERPLPPLEVGSVVTVRKCSLEEGRMKPPEYLSESDLIDLMEQHGLGTDGSIPLHVRNVLQRNLANLNEQRRIVPTAFGIALIRGFNAVDADLVKPQMRATLEKDLALIADGKAKKDQVVKRVLDIYKAKYRNLTRNIALMQRAVARSLDIQPKRQTDHSTVSQLPAPIARTTQNGHRAEPPQNGVKRTNLEDRAPKRIHSEAGRQNQSGNGPSTSATPQSPTPMMPPAATVSIKTEPVENGEDSIFVKTEPDDDFWKVLTSSLPSEGDFEGQAPHPADLDGNTLYPGAGSGDAGVPEADGPSIGELAELLRKMEKKQKAEAKLAKKRHEQYQKAFTAFGAKLDALKKSLVKSGKPDAPHQGLAQQPLPHLENHIPNAGPPGYWQKPLTRLSMSSQATPPPTHPIEDPLNKAKGFFNAFLTMSKDQSPAMYATAREISQQLVDGKTNPDMFVQKLQEVVKSTPQSCLAPILKAGMSKLREGLINGDVNIEGIHPPPASALGRLDPSRPPLSGVNPSFQTPVHGMSFMGNDINTDPPLFPTTSTEYQREATVSDTSTRLELEQPSPLEVSRASVAVTVRASPAKWQIALRSPDSGLVFMTSSQNVTNVSACLDVTSLVLSFRLSQVDTCDLMKILVLDQSAEPEKRGCGLLSVAFAGGSIEDKLAVISTLCSCQRFLTTFRTIGVKKAKLLLRAIIKSGKRSVAGEELENATSTVADAF